MKHKVKELIINSSYTITSNFITLLISTLMILIVPKIIGVEEYGYWQLYLFYSAYVGFLHFGWTDGIYLKYGGKEYGDLNKDLFFSQFHMLMALQLFFALILSGTAFLLIENPNRNFIVQMISLNLLILNVRSMLIFILRGTNRIKEFANITILDRLLYFILITSFLLAGVYDYKVIILGDLIGKFLSLLLAIYFCKDIVFGKINRIRFLLSEALENISIGIKLMFASLTSTLIIGVVRFGIERNWDVSTFGKISLTLSISNFVMIFVNSLGIVMFPLLRRVEESSLTKIYVNIRSILMAFLLSLLIFYYPIKLALTSWLPDYEDSIIFMSLVFPMIIFEGKTSLLVNTYLKTLRKEKFLLNVNVLTLIVSITLTFITAFVFRNLTLTILTIVVLLAFRSVIAEIYIGKLLNIRVLKNVFLDIILSIVFITTAWFFDNWTMTYLYVISYILYLFLVKKDLLEFKKIYEKMKN